MLGQSEKSRQRDGTAGLPSGADIFDEFRHGRFVPHMQCGKPALLFDHLVSAQEEISTDRQSERSRCFEIDDKLEFGGLLNRQVGRLRAPFKILST